MAASGSSLSSVVSNLVRATMGSSLPSTVSDEDLDRHVADLILKEAKQKEEKYFGSDGIRAYFPDNEPESNIPKPNKRFLTSIIKTVDEHNSYIINQQAKAALSAREQEREKERVVQRARADEAARDRMKRLMGNGFRRNDKSDKERRESRLTETQSEDRSPRAGPSSERRHRSDDDRRSDRKSQRDDDYGSDDRRRKRPHWDEDRRRRSSRSTSPRRRESRKEDPDSKKRRRSRSPDAVSSRRKYDSDSNYRSRRDDRDDEDRKHNPRSKRHMHGTPPSSHSPRPRSSERNSRHSTPTVDSLSPAAVPSKVIASSQARTHPLSHSRVRSPSPSDNDERSGLPQPIPSKMDKYFHPAYDPLLDVGPSQPSLSELVPEGAFEHWNAMLELVKLRNEDKAERKRLEKLEGKKSKSKKKGSKKEEEEERERERRIRLGIERPGVMDIKYAPRGAMREWDVGKEVI